MPNIQEQKLLYHLTSLNNFSSILDIGLQPRAALQNFHDVADAEILAGRGAHGLENYVPFHWFSGNPFDERVQKNRPDEDFVLITVHRALALRNNWTVLLRHPLARQNFRLYGYQEGFDLIDWELMNRRDYHDPDCKSVCMAECLSPSPVSPAAFFKIYAPTDQVGETTLNEITRRGLPLEVVVNQGMFC